MPCNILIIRTLKQTLKIPTEWFIYKRNTKLIHGVFNRILGPERTVYEMICQPQPPEETVNGLLVNYDFQTNALCTIALNAMMNSQQDT